MSPQIFQQQWGGRSCRLPRLLAVASAADHAAAPRHNEFSICWHRLEKVSVWNLQAGDKRFETRLIANVVKNRVIHVTNFDLLLVKRQSEPSEPLLLIA